MNACNPPHASVRHVARTIFAAFALLACSLASHAELFRAYLSPTGSDANPCTLAAPCRLLPAALAAVTNGGEIWMLDSGNYNTATVNVTKSVTILAVPGVLGSVVAAGGPALHVATAGVNVKLRNLVVVPLPGGGGSDGVRVGGTTAALSVLDCVFQDLSGAGVSVQGPATVTVTGTTFLDNFRGMDLAYGAQVAVTRSVFARNAHSGIYANGISGTTLNVDVSDTTVQDSSFGIYLVSAEAGGVANASVRGSQVVQNVIGLYAHATGGSAALSAMDNVISANSTGIRAAGAGATAWASGNTVAGNTNGLQQSMSATFETAGNNAVRNNGTNKGGTITKIAAE